MTDKIKNVGLDPDVMAAVRAAVKSDTRATVTTTSQVVNVTSANQTITVPAATATHAGTLSAADKAKLDTLETSKFVGTYRSAAELRKAHPSPREGSYAFVDAGPASPTDLWVWDSDNNSWEDHGTTAVETSATVKQKYEANADTNAFTDAEKSKLATVAAGAEVNVQADWNAGSGDAFIKNKPSDLTNLSLHNATELRDISNAGSGKIITDAERTKLNGIAAGAEVNVQADWNATSGDAQILNKPTLFSGSWNDLTNKPTTFAPSTHSHPWSQVTGAPSTATRWPSWNEVSGKPNIDAAYAHAVSNLWLLNQPLNNADTPNSGIQANYLFANATNKPTGQDHALLTLSYSGDWSVQMAGDWRTNRYYLRNQNQGNWGAWVEMYTTLNKPSAHDVGAYTQAESNSRYLPSGYSYSKAESNNLYAPKSHTHTISQITDRVHMVPSEAGYLGKIDLDTLKGYSHAGFYHQDANVYATTARHYPTQQAGSLLVQKAAGGVTQTYITYTAPSYIYVRSYYGTYWSPWHRVYHTGSAPTPVEIGALPANGKATTAGYADSAGKWSTRRTITLSGGATGSASFDGTTNIALPVVVADNSHAHVMGNITGLQAALDGKADKGAAVPKAGAADQWTNSRKITLTGDATGAVSFNGAADAVLNVTVADNSHAHTIGNISGLQAAINSINSSKMTSFEVQDGDSTTVAVGNGKRIRFQEGGNIDINFTDTSTGSSGDPYDLQFSVPTASASVAGVTSYASNTETGVGAISNKAVTPASLMAASGDANSPLMSNISSALEDLGIGSIPTTLAAVGTYGLFRVRGSATLQPNDTIAGSSLSWANAFGQTSFTTAIPGTWRCMGTITTGTEVSKRTSVFLRIS